MVTFDKIKLVTKANNISIINKKMFEVKINRMSGIISYSYSQKQPYNLFIKLTPQSDEAILEFSSKILVDNYHKLISIDTINDCLNTINKIGICKLNIEEIKENSQVISCDVTKDINITLNGNIQLLLTASLKDLKKFHIQKYKSGFTATKEVKTKWRQLRLSIYNKDIEINSAKNASFRDSLNNPNTMVDYFREKYRIETNLKTLKQIRKYFNTDDTSLKHLLYSNENPLVKIFDILFDSKIDDSNYFTSTNGLFGYESIKQLSEALILEKCNNDIFLVSVLIESYYAKKTTKPEIINRYKNLMMGLPNLSNNIRIMEEIRNKLNA